MIIFVKERQKMTKEMIPELHDVLKITNLQHNLSDFDNFAKYSPKTLTWKGVIQHHCGEEFPLYPTDLDTFVLHLADGMAAGFSRHQISYKGETNFSVYKLWNPSFKPEDIRLRDENSIIELLKFMQTDPSFEEFLDKYGSIMKNRAEDARAGWNITSLYTHSILTGKFYRIFKSSKIFQLSESEIPKEKSGITELLNRKKKEWKGCVSCLKIFFTQKPVRARDLNIFYLLEELKKYLESNFKDNILFSFGNEIMLFLDDENKLFEITKAVKEFGFHVEILKNVRPLEELEPDPQSRPGSKYEICYIDLSDYIIPPICEICQLAPANKAWPEDYLSQFGSDSEIAKEGTEYLCEKCFSIRSRPSLLRKLKIWTEEEDTKVLWIYLNLNYNKLIFALNLLYSEYISKIFAQTSPSENKVRFSLVWEFQQDFEDFINQFIETINDEFGKDNIECILKNFICVRLDSKKEIFKILSIYNFFIDKFFPKFKNLDEAPLKFSLICSPAKFPFFEIWKLIENNDSDLNISLIGHYPIKTSLKYLESLLSASETGYKKSALHKLAEIARISQKLAYLKFQDRTEIEDFKTYENLKRNLLPLGMDFQSILSFSELLED